MSSLQFDLSGAVGMQQTLSGGGGVFAGAYVGRAAIDVGGGGALVRYRARRYGTDSNSITVEQFDSGAPNVVAATSVQLLSATTVRVILRRNAGAILATGDEVAAAVNNFRNANNPAQQLPVVAHNAGTSVVAAAAPAALSGGVDPALVAPLAKFAATSSGGLFYFDQAQPVVVTQMICAFTGLAVPTTVRFQLANLDAGLEPIAAETADLFTATVSPSQPYASFADAKFILFPRQAFLVVVGGIGGMAQLIVEPLASFAGY